jgi:hypothetical protein
MKGNMKAEEFLKAKGHTEFTLIEFAGPEIISEHNEIYVFDLFESFAEQEAWEVWNHWEGKTKQNYHPVVAREGFNIYWQSRIAKKGER